MNYKKYDSNISTEIINLYKEGYAIYKLKFIFKTSMRRIKCLLEDNNIPIRTLQEQAIINKEARWLTLYDEKLNTNSIIHYSKPRKGRLFLITCGICGKTRYSQVQNKETGYCISCTNKIKNKDKPVHKHPFWKGGTAFSKEKYIYKHISLYNSEEQKILKDMVNNANYIFEHRIVMALHLGRPLKRNEVIHHLNGIKHDNNLSNLKLLDPKSHKKEETKLVNSYKQEILRLQNLLRENNISF